MNKSTLFLGGLGILVVWALIGTFISDLSREVNIAEALEASGALFTALAFAAAGYAILLQRKSIEMQRQELELQRQELRDTREELRGQKEQLELQSLAMQKQAFENAFFNILAIHREYALIANKDGELERIIRTFRMNDGRLMEVYNSFADKQECGEVKRIIDLWYVTVRLVLSQAQLSESEKFSYLKVFMAQVSERECLRLVMHIVGKNGRRELQDAVEKFNLFSGYSLELVIKDVVDLYNKSAFCRPT